MVPASRGGQVGPPGRGGNCPGLPHPTVLSDRGSAASLPAPWVGGLRLNSGGPQYSCCLAAWTVVLLLVFLPDPIPEPVPVPAGCEFSFLTPGSRVRRTSRQPLSLWRSSQAAQSWPKPSGSWTRTSRRRTGVSVAEAPPQGAFQGGSHAVLTSGSPELAAAPR